MMVHLKKRLFGIFSSALIGYMWGWIWGYSAVDPNSDIYALAAAVGALIGLVVGLTPLFWRKVGLLLGATIGLYLGWLARTLIFGDVPGGAGLILMLAGLLIGGFVGARRVLPADQASQRILIAALYIGFFGGFLIDVVLLDLVLKLVRTHSILGQAPAVILCGVIGGIVFAKWSAKSAQRGF